MRNATCWMFLAVVTVSSIGCATDPQVGQKASKLGPCQYPPSLEITAVNIGQGDATIIATPDSLVLADAGENYWNSHADALAIDQVLTHKYGCRALDLVLISHLQQDHIGYVEYGGLWYLANVLEYSIGETLIRNFRDNVGTTSGTYDNWRAYLDSPAGAAKIKPRTPAVGEQFQLGPT